MDSDGYSQKQLDDLFMDMIAYYDGDPKRIQHFTKVHSYARLIGVGENLDDTSLFILEAAAYTHDIGIRVAEEKYGSCSGKLQEKEGPAIAEKMLDEVGYPVDAIRRICYLVGHHHTYTDIDGIDYQILIEADYIVNASESGYSPENRKNFLEKHMKTESGKRLLRSTFCMET